MRKTSSCTAGPRRKMLLIRANNSENRLFDCPSGIRIAHLVEDSCGPDRREEFHRPAATNDSDRLFNGTEILIRRQAGETLQLANPEHAIN